jgi:DNA-3-methyladenine glycosylase I
MKNSKTRCPWAGDKDYMIQYHDHEWGRPVHDDKIHFEFLILEGAQAGLSWDTILKRRQNYKKAFANFDVKKVAKFNLKKIRNLLEDEGIIRNKLKVQSAITNAKAFLQVQKNSAHLIIIYGVL